MSIKIAETAGFCYGVKRAVDKTYEEIKNNPGTVSTLGHLIHNRQVVEDLERRGVKAYDEVSDIPPNDTVIIRAHGVKKSVIEELADRKFSEILKARAKL